MTITQDCRLGISASDSLKVWDLGNGTERATLEAGEENSVERLITTKDSKLCISGYFDGDIKVWDLETMQETATLNGHSEIITCLTLSLDENTLWSGAYDKTIRVWSLTNWQELAVFEGHTGTILQLRLIRDGQVGISASSDGTGKLWSLSEKRETGTLHINEKYITGLAILKNERLCLTSFALSEVIRLWDLESCTEVVSFTGHLNGVYSLALTQDEQHFLTGSNDNTIQIWSLARESENRVLSFSEANSAIQVTDDFLIIASGKDIRVWSIAENRELGVLTGHTDRIECVIVTNDQQYVLSASHDCSIKLWDVATRTELYDFTGHTNRVNSLACTPDSHFFLSADWHCTLKLWNLTDKTLVKSISDYPERCIAGMVVAPNGRQLVSIHNSGRVVIWSFPGLEMLAKLSGHVSSGKGVAVTPDGQMIVSCGEDRTVRLWSLEERTTGYSVRPLAVCQ